MKRDMELIRLILLDIEGETKVDLSPYSKEQIYEHKLLLRDAGFIHGMAISGPDFAVQSITMEGHNFLDAARDNKKWKGFLHKIGPTMLQLTLQQILTQLVEFVANSLGGGKP